jgi:hypothetical protein
VTAPPTSPTATCDPIPSKTLLAEVAVEEHRKLLIVGKRVRTVEAGGEYEVFDTELLLARDGCLASRASIGEMSRAADPELRWEAAELKALGSNEGNHFAIERGRVGDDDVVLIFFPLDVRWGLTEYHVAPFTMNGDQLVAGDRVQSGRDAMGGDVYYGQAQAKDGEVSILRHGPGQSHPPIILRSGGDGVLTAVLPAPAPPPAPVTEADRDGHDRAHAIRVCGPKGARKRLVGSCDGSPEVKREGSFGSGPDGHILDRYVVGCGGAEAKVYVDIYHCP